MVSLGCPKARVDSEVMLAQLQNASYGLSKTPRGADAIVINTCSFLQASTQESIDTILEMADYKSKGKCKCLVVTGCLPARYGDELGPELPEVDAFLTLAEEERLVEVLDAHLGVRTRTHASVDVAFAPRVRTTRGGSAYLKIAEGCNRHCSFCTIPAIRGPQRSRSIDSLLQESRQLVTMGAKELVLIAQDLTAYGTDVGNKNALVQLIDALEGIDGLHWIRLMYAYPWNLSEALIERLGAGRKLLPYLDMPLQHVSERVLRDMRRSVSREEQVNLLRALRSVPDLVLRSTFITGFPGETEAEFEELCDWLQEVQFDRVGVFAYSPEPGTAAAAREDQIPEEIREARRDRLMTLQQGIHEQRLRRLLGRELEVLVEGASAQHPLVMEGRYYGQAPEVDGVVYLSFDESDAEVAPGDLVQVRIDEVREYDLMGEVQ
jgi:ribosomal protein S12 methylthiotransferase